jgi:dTMP kinase
VSESLFSGDSNRPGMLVTIDGPNGSGKTILTKAVTSQLRDQGAVVHDTHQPSASRLGTFARAAESDLKGRGLACLVAADRHHQVEGEIAEQLCAGAIVLCDRYIESSLVLQRIDGVATSFIVAINAGIPRPDLRIRLRANPSTIRERLSSRRPDPTRRFERDAGPEVELELYEAADQLLAEDYHLGAYVYDTTHTEASELGAQVVGLIERARGNGSD